MEHTYISYHNILLIKLIFCLRNKKENLSICIANVHIGLLIYCRAIWEEIIYLTCELELISTTLNSWKTRVYYILTNSRGHPPRYAHAFIG